MKNNDRSSKEIRTPTDKAYGKNRVKIVKKIYPADRIYEFLEENDYIMALLLSSVVIEDVLYNKVNRNTDYEAEIEEWGLGRYYGKCLELDLLPRELTISKLEYNDRTVLEAFKDKRNSLAHDVEYVRLLRGLEGTEEKCSEERNEVEEIIREVIDKIDEVKV